MCTATTGDPDDAAKWAKDLLKFTLWTPEDFDARVRDTDRWGQGERDGEKESNAINEENFKGIMETAEKA